MKRFLLVAASLAALTAAPAQAETIGFSMQRFDDTFLTLVRTALEKRAKDLGTVKVIIEDAQGDISRQQSQIENYIASGVDGIIVTPVEADAGVTFSKMAAKAGIPLVFVNNQPANVDSLPDRQASVGSNQIQAGTIEATQVCKVLGGKGKAVVLEGELGTVLVRERTQAIHDVFKTPSCKGIDIVEEQTAGWMRTPAMDLTTNWLSSGVQFNAVIANNDEMALGAIQALKAAGHPTKDVAVAGIDATRDALNAMAKGDLAVTVFQDAASQGIGAIDTVLAIAHHKPVEKKIFTTLELVTPDNMNKYAIK
jgi:ABC-type sugar transport system substrate-binding protein